MINKCPGEFHSFEFIAYLPEDFAMAKEEITPKFQAMMEIINYPFYNILCKIYDDIPTEDNIGIF